MPNIEGNVSSANLNGNISTSSNISGNIYPRGEQGKSGTIQVGEVKTVEYNQGAKVTNVGDENNAIFNFEIPKGKTSEVENVDWGKITGDIDNQNDLKQMVNNKLIPYIKKDENNDINLEGNVKVISNKNTQTIFSIKRVDTDIEVFFGIDSDGTKHGIYSSKLNKWIVEANDEEANFNGNWSGIKQNLETENKTSTWVPVINNGVLEHRVISSDLNNRGILKINDDSAHLKYNNKNTRVDFITAENLAFWNGAYESTNESNLQYCRQGLIQAKPTILFDNSNGIQNDITLNEDINKYERIIIYFKDSEMHFNNSIIVAKPFNKDVILSTLTPYEDGDIKIKTAKYFLQNNLLKFKYSKITNIKSSGNVKNNLNNIAVLRVEGYK